MPRSPAGPSGSVLTGGSDASDSSGGTASGTCHVCGGSLRRGKQDLARRCGECKTRFHANDCGKRRSNAGYLDSYEQCPECAGQCKCVGGETLCHTNTIRMGRICKRIAQGQSTSYPGLESRRMGLAVSFPRPSESLSTSDMHSDPSGSLVSGDLETDPVPGSPRGQRPTRFSMPSVEAPLSSEGTAGRLSQQIEIDFKGEELETEVKISDDFDWPEALLRMVTAPVETREAQGLTDDQNEIFCVRLETVTSTVDSLDNKRDLPINRQGSTTLRQFPGVPSGNENVSANENPFQTTARGFPGTPITEFLSDLENDTVMGGTWSDDVR